MSENNIYQAPQANLGESIPAQDHVFYVEVARRQKHLIYIFLAYIITSVIVANASDEIKPLLQLIGVPLLIAIIIFNIRLCWKLYGTLGRIIMITLGIIPIINLLVVLIANSKANKLLKNAGFKVGFMGVNMNDAENKA